MIDRLSRYYESFLRLLMAAATLYIGLMLAAIVYYTSFRALGWSYHPMTFALIEYGFIYVLMFGSPWLVRTRGHVHIELLTAAVPAQIRGPLSRAVAALCVLICALLAWYTGALALEDFTTDKYDELRAQLDIKRWVVTGSMPLGFGLMGMEFLRFVFGRKLLHSGRAGLSGES